MSLRRSSEDSPTSAPQLRWVTSPPKTLSGLLYHDTAEKAYINEHGGGFHQFSKASTADVFEVSLQHGGVLTEDLDDGGILEWLKSAKAPATMRVLFLDALPEQPDLLPVTESVFRHILDTFDVNSRFIDNLSRQHMPGRDIQRRKDGSIRHQMWHTAVLRSDSHRINSHHGNQTLEFTRQYSYWQRFVMWSNFQSRQDEIGTENSTSTYMIWRCPLVVKQALFRTFSGQLGSKLMEHPMAIHAFIMEKIVLQTQDFLAYFSQPLYRWENRASELRTPDDYTARSRAFLALARQIHQISTDYDILTASIQHLKKQAAWYGSMLKAHEDVDDSVHDAQSTMSDIFENLEGEVKLVGTYTQLYLERSKIGVDECFAMINQRDSELNIQIAQASNQDNRSLRIIQILSMIFLPGSLVSSIFGMGFFSSSPADDGGDAVFTASSRWWLYFAVAVPLTIIIMVIMLYYQWKDGNKAEDHWSRRISLADPEANVLEKKRS
ncbi:hypothetical protein BJ170DRAFT_366212 [Xylariales sp. AK1849]|nr:hypothetical protein BJ170DRAFT_366212 [Xylariales sp. AK1849]